ncbi:ribosome assembly cofactor RimP [Mycoplasmopsis agalactiae]|nr:ribosome assembly cofactor RimP [Mycoplasmopsis agalactiae]MCE6056716.1 ribosome assembly cofactor RimP [Mycoplasmopsis agalactiae]MCE6090596.1 ribosome assembly cofactor RimP [Mycoplasmopsis agalactiae]
MNWKSLLVEKFGNKINDVKIVNEDGLLILEVIASSRDLKDIEELTKIVNDYIDSLNVEFDFDSLSISSPGFKMDYETDELGNHIGEIVDVKLNKNVNKLDFYTGEILENNPESILLKWNCKGQFRKVEIEKANIKKISMNIEYASRNK